MEPRADFGDHTTVRSRMPSRIGTRYSSRLWSNASRGGAKPGGISPPGMRLGIVKPRVPRLKRHGRDAFIFDQANAEMANDVIL